VREYFELREVKGKEVIKIVEKSVIKRIMIAADKPVVAEVIENVKNNDGCSLDLHTWRMFDKSRTGSIDPMSDPAGVYDGGLPKFTLGTP
jgi:hypothetical protein